MTIRPEPTESGREKAELNEWLTRLAEEALADPRSSIPAAEVFRELRAIHREAVEDAHRTKAH